MKEIEKIKNTCIKIEDGRLLYVNFHWCKSCGICMQICPKHVLGEAEVTKSVVLCAPDLCNGCGFCELMCPDYVFSIQGTAR